MTNNHRYEAEEFCKLLRDKCPFDSTRKWEFFINAEVYNLEHGPCTTEKISLDDDKETLNYLVKLNIEKTYKTYKTCAFVEAFSEGHVSSFSHPHLSLSQLLSEE
jgi:hypothetical protein